MSRNGKVFAKMVASVAVAVALALGIFAPSTAFADVGTDEGTITITAVPGNEGVTYNAYKIFTCDVELKPGSTNKYVATNIQWPNETMGDVVQDVIKIYDNTYSGDTPQDAAGFIAEYITGNNSTRVGANGFAENLTKAIVKISDPAPASLTAGTSATLTEGFYLIVTNPSSIKDAQAGSSPIFAMLGNGQSLKITEKTTIPTLSKTAGEGSTSGNQGSYIDAQVGQEVTFTITGTMPDSIPTFTSYYYKVEDELPAGMNFISAGSSFTASDVTVQVAVGSGPTVYDVDSGCFTADLAAGKLTVTFDDLKDATSGSTTIPIDATAKVLVTYKASLNEDAIVGAPGNTNTAKLTYANNPQTPDNTSTSISCSATVYEYQLALYNYDKDSLVSGNKQAIPGAKFTIKATGADDDASTNMYVQEDGSLGPNPFEFVTTTEGLIGVKGLDAGTYTISQTSAPDDYAIIASDLTLTIAPTFWAADDADIGSNAVGSLKSVTATLTGGNNDEYTKVDSEHTSNGLVTIQVSSDQEDTPDPPFTGLLPAESTSNIALISLMGGALLLISLVAIIRRRLRARAAKHERS